MFGVPAVLICNGVVSSKCTVASRPALMFGSGPKPEMNPPTSMKGARDGAPLQRRHVGFGLNEHLAAQTSHAEARREWREGCRTNLSTDQDGRLGPASLASYLVA